MTSHTIAVGDKSTNLWNAFEYLAFPNLLSSLGNSLRSFSRSLAHFICNLFSFLGIFTFFNFFQSLKIIRYTMLQNFLRTQTKKVQNKALKEFKEPIIYMNYTHLFQRFLNRTKLLFNIWSFTFNGFLKSKMATCKINIGIESCTIYL